MPPFQGFLIDLGAMTKTNKSILKALKLEKPKASCGAFVFFAKDMRKRLQDDGPENSFKDVSLRLAELWKGLSDDEREYYEELSQIDKSRFQEEKRIFRQQLYERLLKALKDGIIQPQQVDKSILPPVKQSRPAFIFFSRHVRPMLKSHCENDKAQSLGKALSVMWNSLNNQQRIPFSTMSEQDVQRAREERMMEQEIRTILEEC